MSDLHPYTLKYKYERKKSRKQPFQELQRLMVADKLKLKRILMAPVFLPN